MIKNLKKQVTSNKTKHVLIQNELNGQQDKIEKLQAYDSSNFINHGSQNFVIFQPISNTSPMSADLTDATVEWKSKALSNEKIKRPITANHILSPILVWMNNSKIRIRFTGSSLNHDKVNVNPRIVIRLFIFYESDAWSGDLTLFLL